MENLPLAPTCFQEKVLKAVTENKVESKRRGLWYSITDQLEKVLLVFLGVFLLLDILTGIAYRHVHFDTVFAEELGNTSLSGSAASELPRRLKITSTSGSISSPTNCL